MARAAETYTDDTVRSLESDLVDARSEAAAAAERLLAACRACAGPGQLLIAATASYLASGRLIALANRFLTR